MSSEAGRRAPAPAAPSGPARRRPWWRWILAGAVALVILVVVAVGIFIKLQPAPPPLALPTARAAAPVGPVDGTWQAGPGSVAGFRVRESALGISNDVVGRTDAITGAIVVSNHRVTRAMFRIGLTTMKVGGKVQPQFADSLGTRAYSSATFTLGQPVALSPAFASGAAITATVTGRLAMHGSSRPVTVTISGRRNGRMLQVAGSIPVAFAGWGIKGPGGFGFLGSLANHGVAEFLFVLHRSGTG